MTVKLLLIQHFSLNNRKSMFSEKEGEERTLKSDSNINCLPRLSIQFLKFYELLHVARPLIAVL